MFILGAAEVASQKWDARTERVGVFSHEEFVVIDIFSGLSLSMM